MDGSVAGRSLSVRFRALLVALVVCRGVMLACILPPFEGWDEYQHVAYVDHLARAQERPILGKAVVSNEFIERVAAFPQSACALTQLQPWGAVGYDAFWRAGGISPRPSPGGKAGFQLYQAQHGPLSYQMVAPIFLAAGGTADLRNSVACLRLVNLLFTAAAVWVALGTIGRLIANRPAAMMVGLLVASQPLFLINGVRVANDALGVLLATLCIGGCLTLSAGRFLPRCLGLGAMAGLAVLAKAVNFGLVPFVAFCWLAVAVRDRLAMPRALAGAALLTLGFLAVSQAELRDNLARFGGPTSAQEVLKNRQDGRTTTDLLEAARHLSWRQRLSHLWLRDNLEVGGWSFLPPGRRIVKFHAQVVLACLIGGVGLALGRTRPRPAVFRSGLTPSACAVLCLSFTAGLAYHMMQSQLAWGIPTTNPWYAAAAFPWFILLVAGCGLGWPLGRARAIVPAAWLATFIAAEATVVWGEMVTTYTGGAGGLTSLHRLAALQPPMLGTPTLLAATAGAVVLFALAAFACGRAWVIGPAGPESPYRPHLAGKNRMKAGAMA